MIINILQNHYNLADLCSLNFGNKQNKGIAFLSHINYIRRGTRLWVNFPHLPIQPLAVGAITVGAITTHFIFYLL